jgi:AcrR family transcriptional regulator
LLLLVGKPTNKLRDENERRSRILTAGVAVLRKHGYAGFTQPKVAKLAGVRQSHLTYYFPTRVDLVKAVARVAVDRQLAAIDALLEVGSAKAASGLIANVTVRQENTRVIMALAQASDDEPALHDLFHELADGIILRVGKMLGNLGIKPIDEHRFLLHALWVGMAVINLAAGRADGERRAKRTLERFFKLMKLGAGK